MVEPQAFWPVTAGQWATFIGSAVGFLATIGGLVYRIGRLQEQTEQSIVAVRESFKEQGQRIGEVELENKAHATSIEGLRKVDQEHEFKILDLNKETGEIKGRQDRIIDGLSRAAEAKGREEREIVDRLARIEERLELFVKLYKKP